MNISKQHLGSGILVMCAIIFIFFISFLTTDKQDWDTFFNYFQTLLLILTFAATLIIALANITMSESAQNSATAAKNTVKLQQAAIERLERPYLFVEFLKPSLKFENERYRVSYKLSNYGKTPAVLRGIYVGCQDGKDMFARGERINGMPMVLNHIDEKYEIIGANKATSLKEVEVLGETAPDQWRAAQGVKLFFFIEILYEGPDRALYRDYFLFQGSDDVQGFILRKKDSDEVQYYVKKISDN